jgi:hypothetical protein
MKRLLIMLMLTMYSQLSYTATPYEILGIGENASLAAIRKAYRQRALNWHPDKYKKRSAEEKQAFLKLLKLDANVEDVAQKVFQKINHAYDTLIKQSESEGKGTEETTGVQGFLEKCDDLLAFREYLSPMDLKALEELKAEVEKTKTVTDANRYTLNTLIEVVNFATKANVSYEKITLTQNIKNFIQECEELSKNPYAGGMIAFAIEKLIQNVTKQNTVEKADREQFAKIEEMIAHNEQFHQFRDKYEQFYKELKESTEISPELDKELNNLMHDVYAHREEGVSEENNKRFETIKKQIEAYQKKRAEEFVKQAKAIKDKPGFQEDRHIPLQLNSLISRVEISKQVTKEDEQNFTKLTQDLEQDRKKYATSFHADLQKYLSEDMYAYAKPEINSLINKTRKNNAVTIADLKLLRTALANKTERQQRAQEEKEEYEQASKLTGLEKFRKLAELSDKRVAQARAELAKMEQELKEQEMPEHEQTSELVRLEQLRKDAELAQQLQSEYGKTESVVQPQRKEQEKAKEREQAKKQEKTDVELAQRLQAEEYQHHVQARHLPTLNGALTAFHQQLTALTSLLEQ